MIYSRWRPDTGGYDYFESSERYALADDLPTPSIGGESPIGISSLSCGRKIPSGARNVGSGAFAQGVIAPLSRVGLSGNGVFGMPSWVGYVAAAVGGTLALGVYLELRDRRP